MDTTSEAVDRIVRISMDGAMYAARITGTGAKALADVLRASLKEENKTSGAMRLRNMLKTQKELKVFILTNDQLALFVKEAKRFGVTYCVLRDRNGSGESPAEIMVKAEDSSKVQRIFERLEFAKVSAAKVEAGLEKSLVNNRGIGPEREKGADEAEKHDPPFALGKGKSPPLEGTSEKPETGGRAMKISRGKESVRKEISEIKKDRAEKEKPGSAREKVSKTPGKEKTALNDRGRIHDKTR